MGAVNGATISGVEEVAPAAFCPSQRAEPKATREPPMSLQLPMTVALQVAGGGTSGPPLLRGPRHGGPREELRETREASPHSLPGVRGLRWEEVGNPCSQMRGNGPGMARLQRVSPPTEALLNSFETLTCGKALLRNKGRCCRKRRKRRLSGCAQVGPRGEGDPSV